MEIQALATICVLPLLFLWHIVRATKQITPPQPGQIQAFGAILMFFSVT